TVLRLSVRGPQGPVSGSRLVFLLRNQLLREKSDYLLFRALRVDTVCIKHRSTEHNSSLMMSESELDSDQDTIFSRERPVRSRNRTSASAARNGNAFG
ncbi:hypothetical protein KUCAC02_025172, partial [Chaenocephalus aceratus]